MKRALSLSSEVPMYLKKFLARFVGLTVANVVSAAKNPIRPMSGESFSKPSI